jgi:heat shock protein HslJ
MNIFISAALTILVASCNNTSLKDSSSNTDTSSSIIDTAVVQSTNVTLEGAWQLEPVLPSDTATGRIPTIVFDLATKKFQGNTGCNKMSGNFYTSGDSISFNEQIMMTKMACPGYNEQGFIESLTKTNRYKIEKGLLQLMQDQTILSKWIRKDSVLQKKI